MALDIDPDFWDQVHIPYQNEDPRFPLADPLTVAEQFIFISEDSALLGQRLEEIEDALSDLDQELAEEERKLSRLRKVLIAENYDSLAKSASTEIVDAFVVKAAIEADRYQDLEEMEDHVADLKSRRSKLSRSRSKVKARMRFLDSQANWAKQYLDYDKLKERLGGYDRG